MIIQTKYYGIYIQATESGYRLYETGNDGDEYYDHYPTTEELDNFRERVLYPHPSIEQVDNFRKSLLSQR